MPALRTVGGLSFDNSEGDTGDHSSETIKDLRIYNNNTAFSRDRVLTGEDARDNRKGER